MSQNTNIIQPPEIRYTRADYAALRAHYLKIPLAVIERTFYGEDSPQLEDGLERFLLAMRTDLIKRAIGHNPAFADILKIGRSDGAMTTKALRILIEAADIAPAIPNPGQPIGMWLRPRTAAVLKGEGINSLAELMALIKARGRGWWRGVPRIGQLRADVVVRWLEQHTETLGVLQWDSGTKEIPAPHISLDPMLPARLAPLERIKIPPALAGFDGLNRSTRFSFIQADNDYQAVMAYLSRYRGQPHTLRAYRKELERFLLWSVMVAQKPMSSLLVEACEAYKDFMVSPSVDFIGVRAPRFSARWKPFVGPMSPASQRQAVIILRAAFGWLVSVRYLAGNPWIAVPDPSVVSPVHAMQIEKALPRSLWDKLIGLLDQRCALPDNSQDRIALAAILLMGDSGLRREEAAGAVRSNLVPSQWGADMHELRVLGKRNKLRDVPVSARTMVALRAHWGDRWLDFDDAPPNCALLGPLVVPEHAAAIKRHESGYPGYTPDGLYRLIGTTIKRLVVGDAGLESLTNNDVERLLQATAHAFRHTFGTQATAGKMPLDVVQKIMGHSSVNTTSVYVQAEKKRVLIEAEKYFKLQQVPEKRDPSHLESE